MLARCSPWPEGPGAEIQGDNGDCFRVVAGVHGYGSGPAPSVGVPSLPPQAYMQTVALGLGHRCYSSQGKCFCMCFSECVCAACCLWCLFAYVHVSGVCVCGYIVLCECFRPSKILMFKCLKLFISAYLLRKIMLN